MITKPTKFSLWYFPEPKKGLAVAVCIIIAVAWLWEIKYALTPLALTASINTTKKEQQVLPDQKILFSSSLFGDYIPVNLTDTAIKQSKLDFAVVGILFANNGNDSQVIIRIGDEPERIYGVGDLLPGEVLIKRITEKGVLVLHNGVLERLSLPKSQLIFDQPTKLLFED